MRAAVLVIGLALPLCPGCFTILGAALDAAGTGSSGLATGARIDADIARTVVEGMMSSGGETTPAPAPPADPGLAAYSTADAFLCSIPSSTGSADDAQVIEARSLASALDVCAASNDLGDEGSCVCHAIREPAPTGG